MMRPFGFAAFGAFRMRLGGEGVMGPAHVAARRRGFSFGHRHSGKLLKRPNRQSVGASKGAWVAERWPGFKPKAWAIRALKAGFQPFKHGKGTFRRPLPLRGLELHPRGPGIGIKRQDEFLD